MRKTSLLSLEKPKLNSGSSKVQTLGPTSPRTVRMRSTNTWARCQPLTADTLFFWFYSQYFSAKCIQCIDVISIAKGMLPAWQPNSQNLSTKDPRSKFSISFLFFLSLPFFFPFFNIRLEGEKHNKKQQSMSKSSQWHYAIALKEVTIGRNWVKVPWDLFVLFIIYIW